MFLSSASAQKMLSYAMPSISGAHPDCNHYSDPRLKRTSLDYRTTFCVHSQGILGWNSEGLSKLTGDESPNAVRHSGKGGSVVTDPQNVCQLDRNLPRRYRMIGRSYM